MNRRAVFFMQVIWLMSRNYPFPYDGFFLGNQVIVGILKAEALELGDKGNRPIFRAAHILCYTGFMEKTRQNVTLVVDEDLLLAARKVALDQRTSVNQLVREYLAALVEEPSRRRIARARLTAAFETGLVDVGDRNWSCENLYDR